MATCVASFHRLRSGAAREEPFEQTPKEASGTEHQDTPPAAYRRSEISSCRSASLMLDPLAPCQESHVREPPAAYDARSAASVLKRAIAARAAVGRRVSGGAVGRQPTGGADEVGHGRPLTPGIRPSAYGTQAVDEAEGRCASSPVRVALDSPLTADRLGPWRARLAIRAKCGGRRAHLRARRLCAHPVSRRAEAARGEPR
jgi:hypothetical protein